MAADVFTHISDQLAEYVSKTPFGAVSVELTMDRGKIAKVKFSTELKKMQFLDIGLLNGKYKDVEYR